MKKQLLTLILSATTLASFCQVFKLTPDGLVDSVDATKKYIVVDAPGKKQSDLYKSALIYFSSTYVSPKDVISNVENEVISINGYQERVVHENKIATAFDLNYTIVLKFKEGKIKIEQPSFRMNTGMRTKYITFTGFSMNGQESGLYGKNGKIKSERAIGDIEQFFNEFIIKYKNSINTTNW